MAIQIPFEVSSAEVHAEEMIFDIVGMSPVLTDLNQGGVARTLAEALAIQLEALDSKMFFGLQRAIPTVLYTAFNFPQRGAVKATGTVTFKRAQNSQGPITIPAGTIVIAPATATTQQVEFVTLVTVTMTPQRFAQDASVSARIAGTLSNVAAGRINAMANEIIGIASVYNYAALKNGVDMETDEQRAVRFRKFIINLARSPIGGLEVGAATAQILDATGAIQEIAAYAIAIEPENTLGRVAIYIDNGGGTASVELVAQAQQIIDGYYTSDGTRVIGYKAAGIVVEVAAIESVAVPVTANIEIDAGYNFTDVSVELQDKIEDFFLMLGPGGELILADLIAVIVGAAGVRDVEIVTPTTNLNPAKSQRLLAGVVTLGTL